MPAPIKPILAMSYRDTLLDLGAKPHDYFTQSRAEMIPFVPECAKKIIDIGCGKGELGEQVKAARQAEVWGLEIDPASAKVAETRLDKILTGDIIALLPQLPDNSTTLKSLSAILMPLFFAMF